MRGKKGRSGVEEVQQEVTFLPRLLSNKTEEEEEKEAAGLPPLIGGVVILHPTSSAPAL